MIHQTEAPEPGAESDVYDSVALRTVYVNFPITVYLIKLSSEPLDHRQMSYSRNVSLRCKEVWIKKVNVKLFHCTVRKCPASFIAELTEPSRPILR